MFKHLLVPLDRSVLAECVLPHVDHVMISPSPTCGSQDVSIFVPTSCT